ncbi:MAG: hypothetical protein ACKVOX_11055 [Rhizobacter sp.]
MKPRSARVRMTMLSVWFVLVSGSVHSAGLNSEYQDLRQERLGAFPIQRQAMAGLRVESSSAEGPSITATEPPTLRTAALRAEAAMGEPVAASELDLWTVLAGSLGLMIFVAMRRL